LPSFSKTALARREIGARHGAEDLFELVSRHLPVRNRSSAICRWIGAVGTKQVGHRERRSVRLRWRTQRWPTQSAGAQKSRRTAFASRRSPKWRTGRPYGTAAFGIADIKSSCCCFWSPCRCRVRANGRGRG
jgi:hypothetical protein